MREQWYGDKRDLAKWDAVVHIAKRESIRRIVYTPYLPNRTRDNDHRAAVESEAVWNHFRSLGNLRLLAKTTGIDIDIVNEPFDPRDRRSYLAAIHASIGDDFRHGLLVLLDPDTGLEPQNGKGKATHATVEEVRDIWSRLPTEAILGLYQHAWREKGWLENAKQRYRKALDGADVMSVYKRKVAGDVTFLFAKKGCMS